MSVRLAASSFLYFVEEDEDGEDVARAVASRTISARRELAWAYIRQGLTLNAWKN